MAELPEKAIPVQCTDLTGPAWYGQGWQDAITEMEEIAEAFGGGHG